MRITIVIAFESRLSHAASMSENQKELFLVDASGFIFRAYHALPPLTRGDGTPVGAVLGFTNMLVKLLADLGAPHVAVIFDAARKNFRNDIYEAYKSNRAETPEDLIPQFPLIRQAAEAFGLPVIEQDGFEADDLIAAYAQAATNAGWRATIVGSDKDLMQLVRDPDVRMFDPMKNRFIAAADVIEKFGVPPEKVIDVQSLSGDSIDNIPGVPGIGPKTAAQLITEYGDLETLLSRAGEIKQPKRREALTEHAEDARVSKQLVTLNADAPLPVPFDGMSPRPLDTPDLKAFLEDMGFRALLARLGGGASPSSSSSEKGDAGQAQEKEIKTEYSLITEAQTLQAWIDGAREAGLLAVDTETTHLTPAKADLCGVSLCCTPGKAAYLPLGHKSAPQDLLSDPAESEIPAQMDPAAAMAMLKPLLEDPGVLKTGHNFKYDLQMFNAFGIEVSPVDDTMLMSYVLDGSTHGHGLDELAELLCGHKTIHFADVAGKGKSRITFDYVPLDKARDYAAEDADISLRLNLALKPRIASEKMARVYEDIERPLVPVIAAMERRGVKVDPLVLRNMSTDFAAKLATLEADIHRLAGHEFNVASPKQLGVVLFDEMGLQGGKKTKTGDWSTSADILETLATQGHEIVAQVLEYRQLAKLKSTYTDALPNEICAATGRVHTSFSMALTNTGRLSSSDPNLQNIPIRTEEGRKIRTAFIAEPGWKILSVDYSQVELRLAAEMAGITALKDAFRDGIDIHALTASQVLNVPLDALTSEQRRQAKAVNFGIIYGISAYGLARQLGTEPSVAAEFIKRYLERFPELDRYMEKTKALARKQGYVTTLYGRKCFVPEIRSKNFNQRSFAERQAINAPLQGTAADIMKLAMIRLHSALPAAGLRARMLLQVHDELVFEVPEDEAGRTASFVKEVMEGIADLSVPLVAEAGIGGTWADAH